MMDEVARRIDGAPSLRGDELSGPFWNGCRGGQLAMAKFLHAHGADLNWSAPWSNQTPLDIAEKAEHSDVVAWLVANGATGGKTNA
jgi:uncharacterized protein